MRRRRRAAELPSEVISLVTYPQLDLYLAKFADRAYVLRNGLVTFSGAASQLREAFL